MSLKELAKDGTVQLIEPVDERYEDVLRKDRPHQRIYTFDSVFSEAASQLDVFNGMVKALVDWVVEGSNATVFAYGATGAGKTYTMLGTESNPGIMALTLVDLFTKVEERNANPASSSENRGQSRSKRNTGPDKHYSVSLSYLEIYNENVRDLLSGKPDYLDLREDAKGVVVAGITTVAVDSPEEEATGANEVSSRSHAVLQVTVSCKSLNRLGKLVERLGKLSMIDLAGSERAAETKNRGLRMVEGANINRSLLALGNCINALGDSSKRGKYVNYRDSKLTRLLKDSLGGNCRTVMIANISPSSSNFDETQNTLKYAYRARSIKTKIIHHLPNRKPDPYHATINQLQSEIGHLKQRLSKQISQHAMAKAAIPPSTTSTLKTENDMVTTRMVDMSETDNEEMLDGLADLDEPPRKSTAKKLMYRQLTYDTVPIDKHHNQKDHASPPPPPSDSLFTSLHTTLSGLFAEHRAAGDKVIEVEEEERSCFQALRKTRRELEEVRANEDEEESGKGLKEVQKLEGVVEDTERKRREAVREKEELKGKMKVVEDGIRSIQQSIPKTLDRRSRQYLELLVKLHFTEMENLNQTASHPTTHFKHRTDAQQHNMSDIIDLFTTILDQQQAVMASHGINAPPSLGKLYKQLEGAMGEVEKDKGGEGGFRKSKLAGVNKTLKLHGSGKLEEVRKSREDLLRSRENLGGNSEGGGEGRESVNEAWKGGRGGKDRRRPGEGGLTGQGMKSRESSRGRSLDRSRKTGTKGHRSRSQQRDVTPDAKLRSRPAPVLSHRGKQSGSDAEMFLDDHLLAKGANKKPVTQSMKIEPKLKKENDDESWATRQFEPQARVHQSPPATPTLIPKRQIRAPNGGIPDEKGGKMEVLNDRDRDEVQHAGAKKENKANKNDERERREKEKKEKEKREKEQREKERRDKEQKDRELKEQKEREHKEREQKARELKEREQKEREMKEKERTERERKAKEKDKKKEMKKTPAANVLKDPRQPTTTSHNSPPPQPKTPKDPTWTLQPARPHGHITPSHPATPASGRQTPAPQQHQPPPPLPQTAKKADQAPPLMQTMYVVESPLSASESESVEGVRGKRKKRGFWKRITGRGGDE
ncbi:Kinesin-like protein kif19 [Rhizophlyctis rosea]|nr:Kinesin-like protein kif19 [Rhizophlyctis rosea]